MRSCYVDILGTQVLVEVDAEWGKKNDLHGEWEWPAGEGPTITLGSMDYRTLLHECLHAISDMLHLGLKERQVRGLEVGIGELLRHNRELWESLGPEEERP